RSPRPWPVAARIGDGFQGKVAVRDVDGVRAMIAHGIEVDRQSRWITPSRFGKRDDQHVGHPAVVGERRWMMHDRDPLSFEDRKAAYRVAAEPFTRCRLP